MRIAELTAMHVRTPLKRVVRHASQSRRANDALLVRCRLDNGAIGWGEGLPRPYVTGETIDTALSQFELLGGVAALRATFDSLTGLLALLPSFQVPPLGKDQRDCLGHSVRCAVELSLLDAACRSWNRPISAAVQQAAEPHGLAAPRERAQYSAALSASGWINTAARCWGYRRWEFVDYKVKVGVHPRSDGARLKLIRRLLGPGADLRLDANEAWTPESLEARVAALRPARISGVEQPLPHDLVGALRTLRPRLGVPVVLDESLCSAGDARRAIDEQLCDVFNLRISKCGGLLPCVELAALARGSGLEVQLGCQVGESGILSAAGRAFACTVAGLRWIEGSFDRLLVAEPLIKEDITFGRGGWARALPGSGLGVTVDDSAIDRLTARTAVLKLG